jgi:CheY-like chemotaxis protein
VRVDPNEFELALVNVVINARDAMPKGGIITLSGGNVVLPDGESTKGLEGDYVAVSVGDTGTGIAPDIIGRVFDPFFTTKELGKGTGLGLSQVHGFAHQSGGTVVVRSKLGSGSTITFYLPRSEQNVCAVKDESECVSLRTGTALLVEDNPEVATATGLLLEQLGYKVITAENASVAMKLFSRGGIDLVVSDIVMAGEMDGIQLTQKLRGQNIRVPILLVTGYAEQLNNADTSFTVLRKPFRLIELNRAIWKASVEAAGLPAPNVVKLHANRRAEGAAEG